MARNIYEAAQRVALKLISRFGNPQPLTLERYARVDDGIGGTSKIWAPYAENVVGAVIPLTGDELLRAQKLNSEVSHAVYAVYRGDVLTSDRVKFRGRVFNIRSALNIGEADAAYKLLCDEGVAN